MSNAQARAFFDPFIRHSNLCVSATEELVKLFGDFTKAKACAEVIKRLESDGDTITHETIKYLHETWITPLDRADAHELITSLDDLLDWSDALSENVFLFGLRKQRAPATELAAILLLATQTVAKAVALLPDASPRAKELLAACLELNQLKSEANTIYRKALSELFHGRIYDTGEPREPPTAAEVLDILKWRATYEDLENAIGACEDFANLLEGIVIEYT